MERIADHCSDIAIYIKLLAGLEKVQEPQHFTDMFRVMGSSFQIFSIICV